MSDLIDRLTVVNAIENTDCELPSDAWDELTDAIMSVPSAQQERKVGRWEKVYLDHIHVGHRPWTVCCSECGMIGGGTRYCPNCGAKLEDSDGGLD